MIRNYRNLLLVFCLLAFIFLLSLASLGSEGEALSEHSIPKVVLYQAVNFFGLLLIMYFALRKKVSAYFSRRHDDLTAVLLEAKKQKEEAEQKHQRYSLKIKNLEKEGAKVLDQIRIEGEESKKRIVEEAKRISESIQIEAKRSADNESEKARAELYGEVLEQALSGARALLVKSVVDNDQRRLQKEFVEKIEAVQ
jgi:F-type H+-transporting ATPase subunit b